MPIVLDEASANPMGMGVELSKSIPSIQKETSKLLDLLSPVQSEAVTHKDGPLLIIAGAGSGKTRVITHRIAYLNQIYGIAPWNIAAVTFTNKAAEEMRTRLGQLMGSTSRHVFVRTFHSLGLYILSRHPEALGLQSGFSVIDQGAQKSLLKTILKEGGYDSLSIEPNPLANHINRARDAMLSPKEVEQSEDRNAEEIAQIYKTYIRRLRTNNSVDFSDLLYETVRLLQTQPELCQKYSHLWRYFMIDEYQDTNYTQYLLGRMICQKHENIMVVGDDDQSIYSWRGANIQNILDFEKDYPTAKTLKLEQNYRSTAKILKAASSLIAHNRNRHKKTLFTNEKQANLPVSCQLYETDADEAREIIQKILYHKEQGLPLHHMAIFYRTNAQSRIFERLLRESNLPYIIVGDIRFYDRKEIKDLLAYLSVVANPEDTLSLERIINVPLRGIGIRRLEALHTLAKENNQSLFNTLAQADTLHINNSNKITTLHQLFCQWRKLHSEGELPSFIAEKVLEESGYTNALKAENTPEATGRLENLYALLTSIKEYEQECLAGVTSIYDLEQSPWEINNLEDVKTVATENKKESEKDEGVDKLQRKPNLSEFLQRISLHTEEKSDKTMENSCLYLMTLHNAKGLEFPCVFLSGIEEGYLPHSLSKNNEDEIEEERRLLYVGITRSEKYLYLSYTQRRWSFAQIKYQEPSRFLDEIDEGVLDRDIMSGDTSPAAYVFNKATEEKAKYKPYSKKLKRDIMSGDTSPAAHVFSKETEEKTKYKPYSKKLTSYSLSERVYHTIYGAGTIVKVEKSPPIGEKLSIRFDNEKKERSFLSQYTPLKKL